MKKTKQLKVSGLKKLLALSIAAGALICPVDSFANTEINKKIIPWQQDEEGIVSGSVIDAKTGESLIGAVVMFNDRNDIATITDVNGKFLLQVPDMQKGKLTISSLGFKNTTVEIKGQKILLIPMEENATALEEVVVTGFTTQKKGSVIGSIDRIQPAQLKLPTRTISTSLAGRLAGVIAVQESGEPGYDGAKFWIRGINTFAGSSTPLILVDGIERSLDNVDPEEIADFTILKDATATATYGVRGGNGVVLVTTKKGSAGKPHVSFRAESGFYSPLDLPGFADGPTYMRMQNEALQNIGRTPLYSEEQIERTASGYDPYLYPDVNWIKALTRKASPAERINLNVSGGGENIRYFIAAAVFNQSGMFKRFDENVSFNNNINVTRYNFRSNTDVNVTKTTILSVGLAAILEDRNFPGEGIGAIFDKMRETPPVYFPLHFPDKTKTPGFGEFRNPYQMLARSGYIVGNTVNIQSNFTANQDLSFLTHGLQFKGIFSFDSYSDGSVKRIMDPRPYMITGKDENGEYIYKDMKPNNSSYHDYLERKVEDPTMNRKIYLETSLVYNRAFGSHTIGGLLLYNQSDEQYPSEKNLYKSVPSRTQGITGRASYSFKDTYFAEFNFGYNGSENFMKGRRFGFFPAAAVGWVPTAEPFMKFLKPAIDYMKIRFSHGTVGNDNLSDRFVYLTRVEQTDINVGFGTNNGYGYGAGKGINFTYYGNPSATWEEARKTDLGVEINFLKDFSLQFDLFYEKRTNIWTQMYKWPDLFGFTVVPYANVGEMENKGFDGFLEYKKVVNKDLSFNVKATFSFAKNKVLANGEEKKKYEYQSKIGRPHNSLLGYVTDGYFTDDAQVAASPSQRAIGGTDPKAGDLKYKDINEDGVIDGFDRVFMGYPTIPEITYGVGMGVAYKGFDLSFLFQGADRVSFWAIPLIFKEENYGNVYDFMIDNYWTEDHPNPNATFPRLGIGEQKNNYVESDKWLQNGRYIRLKQAELGYSLPAGLVQKWGMGSLRIYTNGLNLFTLSPFTWWDAESKSKNGSYYPVQRILNVGVEVKF
jgi:TonB-linked SusC/RagA family outer membrane protein